MHPDPIASLFGRGDYEGAITNYSETPIGYTLVMTGPFSDRAALCRVKALPTYFKALKHFFSISRCRCLQQFSYRGIDIVDQGVSHKLLNGNVCPFFGNDSLGTLT